MKKLFIILFLFSCKCQGQFFGMEISPTLNQRFKHGVSYLAPSITADANGCLEPSQVKVGTDSIYTYYTGNLNSAGNSTSICLTTEDIATRTQHKRGIVVGNGVVTARNANCSFVIYSGGTFYMYASNLYNNNQAYLYTSTDGYHFTDQGVIFGSTLIPSLGAYGNHNILADTSGAPVQVGGKYRAYVEANEGANWFMYLLESTSLSSGWTYVQKLTSLLVGTGSYSGPCAILLDGTTHMFYHYSSTGTIPTYLGYATASDGKAFTQKEIPLKRLESLPYGVNTDQNADVNLISVAGKVEMISEYARNTGGYNFTIYKWTYLGTFKELITNLNNCISCAGVYP